MVQHKGFIGSVGVMGSLTVDRQNPARRYIPKPREYGPIGYSGSCNIFLINSVAETNFALRGWFQKVLEGSV